MAFGWLGALDISGPPNSGLDPSGLCASSYESFGRGSAGVEGGRGQMPRMPLGSSLHICSILHCGYLKLMEGDAMDSAWLDVDVAVDCSKEALKVTLSVKRMQ